MYYADLSFQGNFNQYSLVRVGWLAVEHPYVTGEMPTHLIDKLKRLILAQPYIAVERGVHTCDLGDWDYKYDQWMYLVEGIDGILVQDLNQPPDSSHPLRQKDVNSQLLGHSEVWLPSLNDVIYTAPTLIYHYITGHLYLPPQEYLDALDVYDFDTSLDCQKLNDDYWEEYMARIKRQVEEKKQLQAKDKETHDPT